MKKIIRWEYVVIVLIILINLFNCGNCNEIINSTNVYQVLHGIFLFNCVLIKIIIFSHKMYVHLALIMKMMVF